MSRMDYPRGPRIHPRPVLPIRPGNDTANVHGAGIFADGLMFGLVVDGAIHLKVDETNIADFEREGSRPFTYNAAKAQAGHAPRAVLAPAGAPL